MGAAAGAICRGATGAAARSAAPPTTTHRATGCRRAPAAAGVDNKTRVEGKESGRATKMEGRGRIGGALAATWGLGTAAAFLEKSFLGDAFATLLRAGARRDALAVLLAFAVAVPGFKGFGASPVLAFLASGALLGPHVLAVISDVGLTKRLAVLGVCFFLFEMGLELSLGRQKALRRELGLGAAQVAATSIILAKLATPALRLTTTSQAAVVGSALALSSSAFALRLLRDRDDLATAHGRAALAYCWRRT